MCSLEYYSFVHQEVPLTISILDSKGQCHSHPLWYSVLDVLSHEVIIGLVDLNYTLDTKYIIIFMYLLNDILL